VRQRRHIHNANIFIVGMELLYVARTKHGRFNAPSTEEASIECKVAI
jgi:hypothetical protein